MKTRRAAPSCAGSPPPGSYQNVNISRFISRGIHALPRAEHLEFFPVRRTLRNYNGEAFRRDSIASVNLALLAFPQGMAYALIAGLPIQFGIICFVSASLVGSVFSSSRFNSYGPSNATAVLLLSTAVSFKMPPEQMLVAVPVVVMMAGLFLIVGALMKVAKLIQYISRTVIVGYITAAGCLIIANQIKNVLGITIESSASFVSVLHNTGTAIVDTHLPSLAIGLVTAAFYLSLRQRLPKLPNVALTLLVMTGIAYGMDYFGYSVATLQAVSLGELRIAVIPLDFDLISQLATAALAISFLITLEANSIGKSLAARAGDRINPNQEMFALGISNCTSAIFGGMPASASLTRSTLNYNSRCATSLTNVFGAILVAVLFIGLGGFIGMIPVPSLAVLVIMIGITLISRHQIRIVSRATRSDAIVFFTTLGAGLLFALDAAIYLGVAVSIILFLRKVAEPEMVEYAFNDEGQLTELSDPAARPNPEISIVHVEGELFFGAAELFYDQIRRVCEDPNLKIVVLKMRNAHHLDATAVMALEELVRYMRDNDRFLLISEVRKDAVRIFRNSGLINVIGRDNIFPDRPENPTLSTARTLKRARALLGGEKADVKIYVGGKAEKPAD